MDNNKLKFTLPTVYNEWVSKAFYQYVFHFIYGGRASGKSWTTAFLLLSYGCSNRIKVLCLREIQKAIKDSVHSMLKKLIDVYKFPYIVKDKYIYNPYTGTMFIFSGLYRNLESIKSMDDVNVAWIEQAEAVSKESLDVLIPTVIRNPNPKIIYTVNPDEESDPVWQDYMIKKRSDTYYLNANYNSNPFCTPELLAEINRLKIDSYDDYNHIYGGEFKVIGDDILISSLAYNLAIERIIKDEGQERYGVDCARYGKDSSSVTKLKGLKHVFTNEYNQKSTTELARIVMKDVNHNKNVPINVDIGGLGAGTYDTLKDEGYNVKEINFGGTSQLPDKYANIASEMWCAYKDNMNETSIIHNLRLKKELTTRKYKIDKKGRWLIESKDDYKKRGYASPDHADSFLLAHLQTIDNVYYGFV